MDMENNKINPFTNQPVSGNPSFTPPEEINNKGKNGPAKNTSKFGLKAIFLFLILVILGAVLANSAFNFFKPAPQSPENPGKPAAGPAARTDPGKNGPAEPRSVIPEQKQEEEIPPPAVPDRKLNEKTGPFTLSGIFSSSDKKFCIINDKVLSEGDSVENAKVMEINTGEVKLQLDGQSIKLDLRGR